MKGRLRSWVRRNRRGLLISFGVMVLVGSFAGWRTWEYIQNDPTFCTSCHLMDDHFNRWARSPHNEVNCHTCHPGDIASNLHQLWVQITDSPTEVKKHAVVPAEICGQCHLSGAAADRWPQVAATSGHRVHWVEQGIQCVECHAPAVHEFVPTDQMCAKCHPTQVVGLTAMQQLHCPKCHDFLANFGDNLVAGNDRCTECHGTPDERAVERRRPASPVPDVARTFGLGRDQRPPERWGGNGAGGPTATPWHGEVGCNGCHPVHDSAAQTLAADPVGGPTRVGRVVPCEDCHVEAAALEMPAAHECTACHQPHAVPAGEAACRDCHTEESAHMPQRDHHECVSCHTPHQPQEPASERCVECHADDQASATPVAAHRACDACHQPHEPGPPDGPACAVCHSVEARKVASGPAGHRTCDGCHTVHQPQEVEPCGGCHREQRLQAATAPAPHRDCANCHTNHGPTAATSAVCAQCHQKEALSARSQSPEHGRCIDCHAPHKPEIPAISRCGDCHRDEAGLVAAEPPKHQDCRTCHAWHEPKIAASGATCANCHTDHRPARGTGASHSDCASCHPAHRSSSPAPCVACHVREAPRPGKGGAHTDCASCHGPTHRLVDMDRTPCGTCHQDIKAAGLHAQLGHEACLDCHRTHPVDTGSADRCAQCHPPERIKNHPAAAQGVKVCQGCHAFRRGD